MPDSSRCTYERDRAFDRASAFNSENSFFSVTMGPAYTSAKGNLVSFQLKARWIITTCVFCLSFMMHMTVQDLDGLPINMTPAVSIQKNLSSPVHPTVKIYDESVFGSVLCRLYLQAVISILLVLSKVDY